MTTGTFKLLLPESVTGLNDIESYTTHFELLPILQNWRRAVTREGNEVEVDYWPHYFAMHLQKSAIEIANYGNLTQAFRTHNAEKPVVFRGRLSRRVQHPGKTLRTFWVTFSA